jgi:hypothetical protein
MAIIFYAGQLREPGANVGKDQVATSDASADRAEKVPRFWGPFRP